MKHRFLIIGLIIGLLAGDTNLNLQKAHTQTAAGAAQAIEYVWRWVWNGIRWVWKRVPKPGGQGVAEEIAASALIAVGSAAWDTLMQEGNEKKQPGNEKGATSSAWGSSVQIYTQSAEIKNWNHYEQPISHTKSERRRDGSEYYRNYVTGETSGIARGLDEARYQKSNWAIYDNSVDANATEYIIQEGVGMDWIEPNFRHLHEGPGRFIFGKMERYTTRHTINSEYKSSVTPPDRELEVSKTFTVTVHYEINRMHYSRRESTYTYLDGHIIRTRRVVDEYPSFWEETLIPRKKPYTMNATQNSSKIAILLDDDTKLVSSPYVTGDIERKWKFTINRTEPGSLDWKPNEVTTP